VALIGNSDCSIRSVNREIDYGKREINSLHPIIYIHGLNSSCQSNTAKLLRDEFGNNFLCPNLPLNPKLWGKTLDKFFSEINLDQKYTILGSSTGGFFANYFANKFGCKLILVNPVVDPSDLKQFVGINQNFHTGAEWELTENDVDYLEKFKIDANIPTLLFLGQNDEILDYRKSKRKFEGKAEVIVTKDSHIFDLEPHSDKLRVWMG
jgi:hypothetical protein